jgi:hypothetical protein
LLDQMHRDLATAGPRNKDGLLSDWRQAIYYYRELRRGTTLEPMAARQLFDFTLSRLNRGIPYSREQVLITFVTQLFATVWDKGPEAREEVVRRAHRGLPRPKPLTPARSLSRSLAVGGHGTPRRWSGRLRRERVRQPAPVLSREVAAESPSQHREWFGGQRAGRNRGAV